MAFDLGVFLTVVGVVLLSLSQISRVQQRVERSPDTDSPMDIVLDTDTAPSAEGGLRWNCLSPAQRRVMTAVGIYLLLRARTFPVILGLTFLSYAVNVFLFAMGRLAINQPPIISPTAQGYTDPLPQALVLTAIVISFGMTALIVVLALRGFLESGTRRGRSRLSGRGRRRPASGRRRQGRLPS